MRFVPLPYTDVTQNVVYRGMAQFPGRLAEFLGDGAPRLLQSAGNAELLCGVDSHQHRSVALAASVNSPASVADETLQLVQALAEAGVVFVGGFHSPVERLCLEQLAAARWPAIVCLGRTLSDLRIPNAWLEPLMEGKMILVSTCGPSQKRATKDSVRMRNDCVLALADTFLIPHASVGGKTEALCRAALKAGRVVWTLNHSGSRCLVELGAMLATKGKVTDILQSARRGRAVSSQLGD
jgi:predicted Rossmann fold nucleotide-binding protein DprA/Smf involved in DNA uptake